MRRVDTAPALIEGRNRISLFKQLRLWKLWGAGRPELRPGGTRVGRGLLAEGALRPSRKVGQEARGAQRGRGLTRGFPGPSQGQCSAGTPALPSGATGKERRAGPAWGWEEAGGGVPKAEASVVRETGTVGFYFPSLPGVRGADGGVTVKLSFRNERTSVSTSPVSEYHGCQPSVSRLMEGVRRKW